MVEPIELTRLLRAVCLKATGPARVSAYDCGIVIWLKGSWSQPWYFELRRKYQNVRRHEVCADKDEFKRTHDVEAAARLLTSLRILPLEVRMS